jgi:thiol-disulfide isomerase/thioredoxin
LYLFIEHLRTTKRFRYHWPMRYLCFLILLTSPFLLLADTFEIIDAEENEILVEVMPAEGDLLMIWLVDHEEQRPVFEKMIGAINKAGIEIWRVDLLSAYFLPRSSEAVRTLPGDGVASLIEAAHDRSRKPILLAAYDRMPLPLLRGVRLWQQTASESRLAGAMLFYPNLFGPAPLAGEAPEIDPILHATNIPLVIFQPELGSQRLRLEQVLTPLWQADSDTYTYLVPQVRDWFFMGEGSHSPAEAAATRLIPKQIRQFTHLLQQHPKPIDAKPLPTHPSEQSTVQTLVNIKHPRQAPTFMLSEIGGETYSSDDLKGKVVLLNFWATWCPPCVEELPSLNRLQERYRNKDLEIVSVDFRETPEEMTSFLKQTPVDFPVLLDIDGRTSLAWGVFSFPSSFIIDRKGRIRYTANRAIDWDSDEVWQVADKLLDEP